MSRRILGPCLICGNTAVGINFAIPTCSPCKAFFRRNAIKLGRIDFICEQDGDCPVTYETRRLCNCCRLAKCFRVGMEKSLIKTDAEREARKELIRQNREKRIQSMISKRIDLIRSSNLLRSSNNESRCLSLSDQTLLTNIFNAYEGTCIAAKKTQWPCFPSAEHASLYTLFNQYSSRYISLIEYLKLIPEFNRIEINDKTRLITNHFGTMISLNEPNNQPDNFDTEFIGIKDLYSIDIAVNLLRSISTIKAYGHDPILLKLLLIVCTLSSSISRNHLDIDMNRIYDNTHVIFAAQNVYVELLWRYILSRLPSEQDAVKFFNKLMLDLLFMLNVSFMIDEFVFNLPSEIDQMGLVMQSVWPKSNA